MLRNDRSNCCQAPVHVSGDDGTKIYVCNKCQNPCDLYHQTPDKLNEELRAKIAQVHNKYFLDNPLKPDAADVHMALTEIMLAITTAYAEAIRSAVPEEAPFECPNVEGAGNCNKCAACKSWLRHSSEGSDGWNQAIYTFTTNLKAKGLLPNGKDGDA